MTHTPGPWRIDPRAEGHVEAVDGRSVCSISYHDTSRPDESRAENKANARLIAAAPQLKAALQNIMNGISTGAVRIDTDQNETWANAMYDARAALAAAEGNDQ